MARQIFLELHVGQKILVHPSAASHPIESEVLFIDYLKGFVHVKPIGYKVKWSVHPRAISSLQGLHLHYEDKQFSFKETPFWN